MTSKPIELPPTVPTAFVRGHEDVSQVEGRRAIAVAPKQNLGREVEGSSSFHDHQPIQNLGVQRVTSGTR